MTPEQQAFVDYLGLQFYIERNKDPLGNEERAWITAWLDAMDKFFPDHGSGDPLSF